MRLWFLSEPALGGWGGVHGVHKVEGTWAMTSDN